MTSEVAKNTFFMLRKEAKWFTMHLRNNFITSKLREDSQNPQLRMELETFSSRYYVDMNAFYFEMLRVCTRFHGKGKFS